MNNFAGNLVVDNHDSDNSEDSDEIMQASTDSDETVSSSDESESEDENREEENSNNSEIHTCTSMFHDI